MLLPCDLVGAGAYGSNWVSFRVNSYETSGKDIFI
jgi:hypothetical protein